MLADSVGKFALVAVSACPLGEEPAWLRVGHPGAPRVFYVGHLGTPRLVHIVGGVVGVGDDVLRVQQLAVGLVAE